jgi:hypothetical protein
MPDLPIVCPCGARYAEEFARQRGMKCMLCKKDLGPQPEESPEQKRVRENEGGKG